MKKAGRIALKTLIWFIASIVLLVLLLMILIQVPAIQNFALKKTVAYLENKIHTKVQIGHINLLLPKSLELNNIYFEDQQKDTLLAGETIRVDINMLKLFRKEIQINEIDLKGITAKVSRGTDSIFNFDYIVKAFAGEQEKEVKPEDTTSTMKFSLDRINLDKINLRYNDKITGNDIKFYLGHFDTRIRDFDMDHMKFTIPKITLSDINARIIQSGTANTPETDTATESVNMDLDVATVDISKIKIDYQGHEMALNLDLGALLLDFNKIDLPHQHIDIKSFLLNNTYAALTLRKPQTVKEVVVQTAKHIDTLITPPQSMPWIFKIHKAAFTNDNLKFDNEAEKPVAQGFDYAHMDIRNLKAQFEGLAYYGDSISGEIKDLSFSEKSGLAVQQLKTAFFYGPKHAYLQNLYLKTPNTLLQKSIKISYPSIEDVSKNTGLLGIQADLPDCRIAVSDVLLFAPFLAENPSIKNFSNSVLKLNGKISGRVDNLQIPKLAISGLGHTNINASADIKGLPDASTIYMDVHIADFNTNRKDILALAPKGTIPSNIAVPERLNLKGNFKGSLTYFNTQLALHSSDGDISLTGAMDGRHKDAETYTANIKASDLNVGAIIKQPQQFGKVSLTANVSGKSLNPKKADIQLDGNISKAYINGYLYQDLSLKANAQNGNYTATADMQDPNIRFQLKGDAQLDRQYTAVHADLMVDSINFQALHFTSDPLLFHGKITVNAPTADPDYLNAAITASELLFVDKDQRIELDSIKLISTASADSNTIQLTSPGLQVDVAGKYKLTQLGPSFQNLIKKYLDTDSLQSNTVIAGTKNIAAKTDTLSPQQLSFSASFAKTPVLTQFVPELKQMDTVKLWGQYNSTADSLHLNGVMPKVIYGTDTIDNARLSIYTADSGLYYRLIADAVKIGQAVQLHYPGLTGAASDNHLSANLSIRDEDKKMYYRISALAGISPDQYRISLVPDSLLLDYTPWQIEKDNFIQYGKTGLFIHHFNLSDGQQSLRINSGTNGDTSLNAPVTAQFDNFHLETLTKIARQDSIQIGGALNGNVIVDSILSSPKFTSDLHIQDLNFKGDTLGDIALKVDNQTENAFAAKMELTGKGNQIDLNGLYYTAPESRFDLDLNISRLNMKSIEGLTLGNLRNTSGYLNGRLKIAGTTDLPKINGDIHFNKVGFNVAMLNSFFSMPDESLSFTDNGIQLNKLTLVDSTGRKAVMDGIVKTKTYRDYAFDLSLNARDFRVINSTRADNQLYYGKLFMDARLKIHGDMNSPVIDGTLGINDKTDLTVVLPSSDPSIEDRKGVVEFIDKNNIPNADSILLSRQLDSLRKTEVHGMDISATINIDKNAAFTIVIDPRNGDEVHLRGEAHLNGGIDPSGKTNLTGTYEVNDGSYNLSYATVKRKFNFKKGSSIVWTGDPTSANVDLTAVYVAKVPPIDLVENQLASSENSVQYKQKLPFNINLILKNQLLKPDISFDIVLPDSNYTVSSDVINTIDTRLSQIRQDPNEMNKQVLGVLVLGHFIGDNPLESQGGNLSVEGAIRNSVSSLLSDQLNKLADNLISGVDIDFGLTSGEDYSSGTATNRTDLNVGVSKSFLDDRLTVSVGNNFNLEGGQQGEKATNIAGNVSVNYKLSRDGRYMLRAYRQDKFIVIQGQIIETGLGFTLTVDYNKFKEILAKRSEKEKAFRRRYKAQKAESKRSANEDAN